MRRRSSFGSTFVQGTVKLLCSVSDFWHREWRGKTVLVKYYFRVLQHGLMEIDDFFLGRYKHSRSVFMHVMSLYHLEQIVVESENAVTTLSEVTS